MATDYYVRKTGSDEAAGTTPATAWATIGFALGGESDFASGDTLYIGAGVYRECVTVGMESPVAETKIIADVDGSHAGDAGEVVWTAFLDGDSSEPSEDPTLDLNGCDYLTLEKIVIVAGYSKAIAGVDSAYITLTDCTIIGNLYEHAIYATFNESVAAHWAINRCVLVEWHYCACVYIKCYGNRVGDLDIDFTVQNCLFVMGGTAYGVWVNGDFSGSASCLDGGLDVFNCSFLGGAEHITIQRGSTTYPVQAYNNLFLGGAQNSINASDVNMAVADYNYDSSDNGYNNVDQGAHDVFELAMAAMLQFGQELMQGKVLRPFLTPMAGSPFLGFGNQAGGPSVDFWNRPRPAGGQTDKGIGYLERHDTATKETSVYDATPGIVITGPGDHDFRIPVAAESTTISVKARYDSDHGTTNKPQAIILANPEIGVTTETKTMTEAGDTWETLTFTAQTPSAAGVVTVRLVSRAAAAAGHAYFDTFAVS